MYKDNRDIYDDYQKQVDALYKIAELVKEAADDRDDDYAAHFLADNIIDILKEMDDGKDLQR